MLKLVVLSPRL